MNLQNIFKQYLVLNGPNLNLLGEREQFIYGSKSLLEIEQWTNDRLQQESLSIKLNWFQTNSESVLIDQLHLVKKNHSIHGVIINPAGLSHTSVSLLDALLALKPLAIAEVHLSNPSAREEFRHHLLTAKAATIIMGGLGFRGYYYAARALYELQSA